MSHKYQWSPRILLRNWLLKPSRAELLDKRLRSLESQGAVAANLICSVTEQACDLSARTEQFDQRLALLESQMPAHPAADPQA